MTANSPLPEVWLRGPIEGVPALLQPAAHALLQAGEDLERAAAALAVEQLWARPAKVASVGFHLRHIAGVIDRLFTYARGEALSAAQLEALGAEGEPGDPPASARELLHGLHAAIERALADLRTLDPDSLLDARAVGRKQLPSTVLGLLFHAAEHAQRHTGQALVTARLLQG